MIVSIRAQYSPERDWRVQLEALRPVTDIELAFYKVEEFLAIPLEDIDVSGVTVQTIHMAHAYQTEWWQFVAVLTKTVELAQRVGCQNIVLHPSYGPVDGFDSLVEHQVLPLLGDCNLLWETFAGKRRLLTAWPQLAEFCERHERNFVCYDLCHMRRSTDGALEDIEKYGHLIKTYHLSNWTWRKQHMPVDEGELDLRRVVKRLADFDGPVTLEYLFEYHHRLVADALLVRKWVGG